MYSKRHNLTIGFHGCDSKTRDFVINGGNLNPSTNEYDWLGNGLYFWEDDPVRAMEWAVQLSKNPKSSIKNPVVLGAVIDLGNCLDLISRQSTPILKMGYEWLKKSCELNGVEMPVNKNIGSNTDLLLRNLDCAVIEKIHSVIADNPNDFLPFDSVRGLFYEGNSIYEGSGFKEKTHIQLCIVNPNCIKGYFIPREIDKSFSIP